MHPDYLPIARVVGSGDGNLAGQNDEKVVGALTLANQRFARVDGAPGTARLEGDNLTVGQSRVRAVVDAVEEFGRKRPRSSAITRSRASWHCRR